MLKLLGTMPDKKVAGLLGISAMSVFNERHRRGVESFQRITKIDWTAAKIGRDSTLLFPPLIAPRMKIVLKGPCGVEKA